MKTYKVKTPLWWSTSLHKLFTVLKNKKIIKKEP